MVQLEMRDRHHQRIRFRLAGGVVLGADINRELRKNEFAPEYIVKPVQNQLEGPTVRRLLGHFENQLPFDQFIRIQIDARVLQEGTLVASPELVRENRHGLWSFDGDRHIPTSMSHLAIRYKG
jgi:hypothetical protein